MSELVGRNRELATLDRLVSEAGGGEFRLLQVEGEPGIGKSRLLDELAARADRQEWLVLRGSAAEFESELPFGPVIDALDAYLMALDPRAIGRLGPDTAETLAEVFPSLAAYRKEARGPVIASERFRIHHAIRELLERLSGRAPMALLLDDLHWADQASLELVGHLLRRPPQAGILLALANRSGQLDPILAASLATGSEVTTVSVGPLDLDETAELTGATPSRVKDLFSETGGNPFYALELMRAGIDTGGGRALPEAVAAAISAEAASLSPDSRRFSEAAAVVGDPFDIDLVGQVTGREESPAELIDELTGRGLIRPTEIPRRFAFRHPLVRSAIYESTPPGTRLADHERAALVLADSDAPATEQARHLVLAARPGDEEAAKTIATGAGRNPRQRACNRSPRAKGWTASRRSGTVAGGRGDTERTGNYRSGPLPGAAIEECREAVSRSNLGRYSRTGRPTQLSGVAQSRCNVSGSGTTVAAKLSRGIR